MTTEQFAYWLQGALEVFDPKFGLDAKQVQVVRDHLALVFEKFTPVREVDGLFCGGVGSHTHEVVEPSVNTSQIEDLVKASLKDPDSVVFDWSYYDPKDPWAALRKLVADKSIFPPAPPGTLQC